MRTCRALRVLLLCVALRDQLARARRASSALARHAQLALNRFEVHARAGMAGDFSVGNPVAYTNNHGCKRQCWLVMVWWQEIINKNLSYSQYSF